MVQSQTRQIVHEILPWKNPSQKRTSGVAQGVGPEFKPQHQKKNTQCISTLTPTKKAQMAK
jgi:hypothetical protein